MRIRNEYPRPQLRRDEWLPLNGQWQFDFDDEADGLKRKLYLGETDLSRLINVPFTYQYEASGIGEQDRHEVLWYKRGFTLTDKQLSKRALICFNGCDYVADVWVNGFHVTTHQGAYTAFTADITDYVTKENVVVVRCYDPFDPAIPRGKQSWTNERFGCWYVPNSGIWQSVWVEFFETDCLDAYSLIPNIDDCSFGGELTTLYGRADKARFTVSLDGKVIKTAQFSLDGKHTRYNVSLTERNCVDEDMFWSVERPNLIYVDIELYAGERLADAVHTRFGMRKISVNDGIVCLNNSPLYQRLILDQGYFAESGITPPSTEAIKRDIELSIAMGFNGARKHQKIEDPYFYYYAEELGFLVWCEMPSAYSYNSREQQLIMREWQEIVRACRNYTSVVCYVPLNESWGVRKILNDGSQQDFARSLYYATRALDESRIISTNDGWENVDASDIVSVHDYSMTPDGFAAKYDPDALDTVYPQRRKLLCNGVSYNGAPVLMTEFGGIAMQNETNGDNWGYNVGAKDNDEFYARYGKLIQGISELYFQGFCYTQLTDAQQEVNGLLDEHHNPKFDVAVIKKLTDII